MGNIGPFNDVKIVADLIHKRDTYVFEEMRHRINIIGNKPIVVSVELITRIYETGKYEKVFRFYNRHVGFATQMKCICESYRYNDVFSKFASEDGYDKRILINNALAREISNAKNNKEERR
jgi:uncharacterized protein YtpQ (UPF0354 family)